jgi:RPEL repeat
VVSRALSYRDPHHVCVETRGPQDWCLYANTTTGTAEATPVTVPPTSDVTSDAIIIDEAVDKVEEEEEVDAVTARKQLERKLSLRPEKKDLVERNILKGALRA